MTTLNPLYATSTASSDSPLGDDGVLRESRWKRPLIKPPGSEVAVPYTRASSLADYATNQRGIHTYEMRTLAVGMGVSEDLCALAATESYRPGFTTETPDEHVASGRRLDRIIERAMDRVGVDAKADMGTAGHSATNPDYDGHVPSRVVDGVAAWRLAVRGFKILDTEVFTANHRLRGAGTFDHLLDGDGLVVDLYGEQVDCTGTVVVVDKKFGKFKRDSFEIQTAVYAGGVIHGKFADWGKTWSYEEKYGKPANQVVGLIAWIPFEKAEAVFIPVDLRQGRWGAGLAAEVRDYQRGSKRMAAPLDTVELARKRAAQLLGDATSVEELNGVYAQFSDVWTKSLTTIGQEVKRLRKLTDH